MINEDRGDVLIKQPLDYDTEKIYTLNITAKDMAFYPKYATATLTVKLADVNDNPPVFTLDKYDAHIAENSELGTFVYQLEASDIDHDQNAIIEYKIVGGSGKDFFSINSVTGSIYSKRIFDYEEKN